jgi:hypothetical protein
MELFELSDKDSKAVIIPMLKEMKGTVLINEQKERNSWQRNRKYLKRTKWKTLAAKTPISEIK